MDIIRGSLAAVLAVGLVGCASIPGALQEDDSGKKIHAGGMTFYFDPSKSCGENVTCYSSDNYSFGIGDFRASGLQAAIDQANNKYGANISSNPEQHVYKMGNQIRDMYNNSSETVMGTWSNDHGKLSSDKGYKMYLGHVSDSPDKFLFLVTVMCTPEGVCEFNNMANIFSDVEEQLLKHHDLSKPLL